MPMLVVFCVLLSASFIPAKCTFSQRPSPLTRHAAAIGLVTSDKLLRGAAILLRLAARPRNLQQQAEPAPERVSSPTDYPFRAVGALYVKYRNGNTAQCSAALVAEIAILTAGHCAWNVDTGAQHCFSSLSSAGYSVNIQAQIQYLVLSGSELASGTFYPSKGCRTEIGVVC